VARIAGEARQLELALNVNKHNPAQDFYRKLGFSVVGYEDIDIGEGFMMEDAIMRRDLSEPRSRVISSH
jgi:ribosomal protein S18 acetylase RimI-like enzyme